MVLLHKRFKLGVPKALDPFPPGSQIPPMLQRGAEVMHRTEEEFCRDQYIRLLKLAKESPDRQIRDQLVLMANEWLEQAKAKDKLAK
jgi:hypothetical protein